MVVIDTDVLKLLSHATRYGDFPRTTDANERAEQVATFRLFLWQGLGSVGRVVVQEVEKHPHDDVREQLRRIIEVQLPEVWVQPEDQGRWETRTAELRRHHGGELDCRVVAETELVGADALVTFDEKMIRALARHSNVKLLTPTEQWTALQTPRGTLPKWRPDDTNPPSRSEFWRWD